MLVPKLNKAGIVWNWGDVLVKYPERNKNMIKATESLESVSE